LAIAVKQHVEFTKSLPVKVISYVVVLTDGEDTSSKITLQQTRELFSMVNRLANFKVILAGINLNSTAYNALQSLGAVGDKDIEFRNLASNADLENLFEHITLQLKVERTVLVVDPESQQAAAITRTAYVPMDGSGGSGGSYPAIEGGEGYNSSQQYNSSSSARSSRATGYSSQPTYAATSGSSSSSSGSSEPRWPRCSLLFGIVALGCFCAAVGSSSLYVVKDPPPGCAGSVGFFSDCFYCEGVNVCPFSGTWWTAARACAVVACILAGIASCYGSVVLCDEPQLKSRAWFLHSLAAGCGIATVVLLYKNVDTNAWKASYSLALECLGLVCGFISGFSYCCVSS